MDKDIERVRLDGEELTAVIDDLASLWIEVFREYPYLYDGSHAYEQKYLQTYCNSPQAVISSFISKEKNMPAGSVWPAVASAG